MGVITDVSNSNHNKHGYTVFISNTNPLIYKRVYELGMPDGTVK